MESARPLAKKNKKPFIKKIEPFIYLMPAIIFLVMFTYYPFFKTIISSFFVVNSMGQIRFFAGISNYVRVLSDPKFITAVGNTFFYVLLAAPLSIFIALALSLLSQKRRKLSIAYETLFAITMAMSMSVSAMIFKLAYNPSIGILNHLLGVRINWLNDKRYAMFAISIISTWMNIGYNFLFLLAAVRNIPQEIIESSDIDGANVFTRTIKITMPLISPTLFFLIVSSLARSMMMSGLVLIFTSGAALNTTASIDTMISYMYKQAVNNLNYNDAYASAIIAFIITFILMIISFKIEKKGVHYN